MSIYPNRICKTCGVTFEGGPRAWYCPTCREERQKAATKAYRQRAKNGTSRAIGSEDVCQSCGSRYIVAAGLQKYCSNCQKQQMLELDRHQGLTYYHANKDVINPIRNAKRRNSEKFCIWCGERFYTHTKRITCSAICSRLYLNKRQAEQYGKIYRFRKKGGENNE